MPPSSSVEFYYPPSGKLLRSACPNHLHPYFIIIQLTCSKPNNYVCILFIHSMNTQTHYIDFRSNFIHVLLSSSKSHRQSSDKSSHNFYIPHLTALINTLHHLRQRSTLNFLYTACLPGTVFCQRHWTATPASLAACARPNPVQDSSHHLPDLDDADTDLLSFTDPPVHTIKDSSLVRSAFANCA